MLNRSSTVENVSICFASSGAFSAPPDPLHESANLTLLAKGSRSRRRTECMRRSTLLFAPFPASAPVQPTRYADARGCRWSRENLPQTRVHGSRALAGTRPLLPGSGLALAASLQNHAALPPSLHSS